MAEARRMGKSELFSHFAERFELKRAQAREFFDELTALAEKELQRSGEFTVGVNLLVMIQPPSVGHDDRNAIAGPKHSTCSSVPSGRGRRWVSPGFGIVGCGTASRRRK